MKTSIATVCLSGTLTDKLRASAEAGFDGVEIFEPDLIAAPESPEEIRALAARLGLALEMYQPMRDVEGVTEELFADVLRRAEEKFRLMNRLGIDLVLCCSNVGTATVDDDEVSASQLRRLGDLAARHGVRVAFEALAWGRFIDDYRRAWRVVERADHPAVGVCLDSFHVLSRGHDPAAIEEIPADKIFFLQLADAPALSLDVLSWSRHHRLFPGEGSFDLAGFVAHTLRAGYRGPLSLEVFNDTFRQTDVAATAAQAHRSLRHLEDEARLLLGDGAPEQMLALPASSAPTAVDFIEVKAEDTSSVEVLLAQVGFTPRGRHRTKPVTLWAAGDARVILNEQHAHGLAPHLAAVGFQVEDPDAVTARAGALRLPRVQRRTYASEQQLEAAIAPDGTEVFWSAESGDDEPSWVAEFLHGSPPAPSGVLRVDHVSLTQPWGVLEDSVLFYGSAFGLVPAGATDVAGPRGLVHSRVMQSPDGSVRIPMNVAPVGQASRSLPDGLPQHVAVACDDVIALARTARERGLRALPIPDNYYDDLAARFALPADALEELRSLDLLYDRDESGQYLHFYSGTVGNLFWEFVERRGAYDGFGAGNAPVRLMAQGAPRGATGR